MSHVDEGTLHVYFDGELSPAEAQGVDAHVAQCPGCRARLDEERALIARASELLALAAPPDRQLPPFRAGDVKPPARLWWQVRWPLAWAATVVLALGIGTYVGRGFAPDGTRPVATAETKQSPPLAARSPSGAPRRASPTPPPAAAPPAAAPVPNALPEAAADRMAVTTPAPAKYRAEAGLSLDSARVVLGQDPVVLPGAAVRAIRHEGVAGYDAVVVIEQQLDTNTVIELIERRGREAPGVAGAAGAAGAVRPLAKARADTKEIAEQQNGPVRLFDKLQVRILGPLPADSLQKLLERVQPVKGQP